MLQSKMLGMFFETYVDLSESIVVMTSSA